MKTNTQRILSAINAIKTVKSTKDELTTSIKLEKMRPSDTGGSKEELEDIKIMPYGNVTRAQWESFLRKAKWPYWNDWETLVEETTHTKDSCVDELSDEDLDDLIAEEYEAIADYSAALAVCSCEHAKQRLTHILEEEKEHVKELEALKESRASDSKVQNLKEKPEEQEANLKAYEKRQQMHKQNREHSNARFLKENK